MNKLVIGIIALIVIVSVFVIFNNNIDLAPRNNNNFIATANSNLNFAANGTIVPYLCRYSVIGGGGGGCSPSMGCSCTDSDNGNNPCIFGVANVTTNQTNTIAYRDYCIDSMNLSESFCGTNGTVLFRFYSCQDGCSNGACIVI